VGLGLNFFGGEGGGCKIGWVGLIILFQQEIFNGILRGMNVLGARGGLWRLDLFICT
jgi:hypothetical protein